MKKILILASNPRKDLNLDREIRDLQEVIERSQNREQFEVVPGLAVRVGDLQELMLKNRPQIVHFCGHGSGKQGLVFEGNDGGEQWVRAEALSELFRIFANNIGCILLNACYSEEQANAIVNHIDYVIGMNQEIRDDAAIAFSKGFYRALGYECPIEEAYELGRNAIQLEISGSSKMRSAAIEKERKVEVINDIVANTEIPEHLKPILKIKPSLITRQNSSISQEKRTTIRLDIDKSLEIDPIKQYRERVRLYLADRKISTVEKIRLKQFQEQLGLSKIEADRILEEEFAPIKRSQQNYRDLVNELIEEGHYPFDETIEDELKQCQREENLTDEEVEEIFQPILEAAEKYRQQLKRSQQNYRDLVNELIEEGHYPFDETIQDELKQCQQEENLTDEEVDEISHPILEAAETAYQQKLRQQAQQEFEAKFQRFEFEVIRVNNKGQEISRSRKAAEVFAEDLGNGIKLEMVKIPGGTFLMGTKDEEIERLCKKYDGDFFRSEKPQHQVTVQPFLMGKYPITQAQWKAIARRAELKVEQDLEPDPSDFKGDARPVEQVSWYDAVEFCARLSKLTKWEYRLPSEAEWEYACRAGTKTPFYFGETITDELANYTASYTYADEPEGKYRKETTPVGQFPPNAFGLYDMHGQVWEWCADNWHENYNGAPKDGSTWINKTGDINDNQYQILRGGSWYGLPDNCGSAYRLNGRRDYTVSNFGFRVVCVGGRTV